MYKNNIKIGDNTNVGVVSEIFDIGNNNMQIQTENGIFFVDEKIYKIEKDFYDYTINEYANYIKKNLYNEYGKDTIYLFHGTSGESYMEMTSFKDEIIDGVFGHSDNSISFFTNNRSEAKEYMENKSKFRNENNGKVLKFKIEKAFVYKNHATGEYESPYQFKMINNGTHYILTPTDESLINYELKQNKNYLLLQHFKTEKIKSLFNNSKIIDLHTEIHKRIKDYNNIDDNTLKNINSYIKSLKDKYKMESVLMFHGTSKEHKILNEGLKKTTNKNKKSLQSGPGYVYLTTDMQKAKTFAEFAYPDNQIEKVIYAIRVYFNDSNIKPDKDQIKNKNLYSKMNLKFNLLNSLVHGGGFCLKRNIEPYDIIDVTNIVNNENLEFIIEKNKIDKTIDNNRHLSFN